jgi:thymidylate kinase
MVTEVTKGKLIVVDGMDGAGKTTAMGSNRSPLSARALQM